MQGKGRQWRILQKTVSVFIMRGEYGLCVAFTPEIPAVGRYRWEIGSHPLATHQVQGQPGAQPQDINKETLGGINSVLVSQSLESIGMQ